MTEPMTDARLEQLAGLAELPCSCDNADCGNYTSALTAQEARELVAEARRPRAALAEHPDEWGVALTHGDTSTTSAGDHEDVARRSVAVDPGRRRLMHRRKASQWREIGGDGD